MNTTALLATQPQRRMEFPIGTVRIRKHNGLAVRFVKIRSHGPISGRWIHYARWWWERNKGPVPAGKRVCHIDGDSLNDDPANYELLTPGDVAFLCHERDPKMSARNFAKMREATAEMNRARGAINRQLNWLPTRWYPVDFSSREIINQPRRQQWQIYADAGVCVDASTWRMAEAAALGWSGVSFTQACILAALAEIGTATRLRIKVHAAEFRRLIGWTPAEIARPVFYSCVTGLGDWVTTVKRGRRSGLYQISADALAARTAPCRFVPVRGCELSGERFHHFTKVTPGATAEVAA